MDPHTPTQMDSNTFPALPIQRPPSSREMAGPVRTAATDNRVVVQPPRPPNAWILYRSDKLRALPPLKSGEARRAQADVSRMISQMWKDESEATRAEYERRAEQKKTEHAILYPGYRFQPMKKEEKERLREKRKLEKEADRQSKRSRARPTSSAANHLPSPLPHPIASFYPPELQYGPAGPSPPLSAASSPNYSSPYPETPRTLEDSNVKITDASPYPESHSNVPDHPTSTSAPSIYVGGLSNGYLSQYSTQDNFPQPGPSQWQPQQPHGRAPVTASPWEQYCPPQQGLPVQNNVTSSDYVSFDVQPLSMESMQPWLPNEDSSYFDESMRALLSATGDPSIFQLSNFDPNSIIANPDGEIEVSMGQLQFPFDISTFTPDFNFDFGNIPGPSTETLDTNSAIVEHSSELASVFPTTIADPSSSDYNNYADEYLNFEDGAPAENTISNPVPPLTPASSQSELDSDQRIVGPSTTISNAYVPPAGAAYSSTRRVAGSWKPSFAIVDLPIDHSPPRSWGVPAT